jgi:hypothetical protein
MRTTAVQSVAEKVVRHLRDGRRAALDALFMAGDEIHKLRTTTGRDRRPVAQLAAQLKMDESGLQKWGRLAELVRGQERDTLCSLTDRTGFPLTPSLLVELERVRDAAERMRLAGVALEKGLSIAELRTLIRNHRRRASPKASAS